MQEKARRGEVSLDLTWISETSDPREAAGMEKRTIRVVKWLGATPAVAVCTGCDRTFKVPLDSLKRTADAQESLRKQFAVHKCERPENSQKAQEATDDR